MRSYNECTASFFTLWGKINEKVCNDLYFDASYYQENEFEGGIL